MDKDHHLEHHYLRVFDQDVDRASNTVSWRTKVRYSDENDDDDYHWKVRHGVLSLDEGVILQGRVSSLVTEYGFGAGGMTIQDDRLKGLADATVILAGSYFNWKGSVDRHIQRIGCELEQYEFDPVEGELRWAAWATFEDDDPGHNFWWGYDWVIVGLEDGQVVTPNRRDWGDPDNAKGTGRNQSGDKDFERVGDLTHYETLVVLPQAWRLDFPCGDEHLDVIQFEIFDQFLDDDGNYRWEIRHTLSDKKDNDFHFLSYQLQLLAFNGGHFHKVLTDDIKIRDGGGSDDRTFSSPIR